jgi:hypothetical protein
MQKCRDSEPNLTPFSVEPPPIHGGFENHTAAGVLLDKVDEELRGGMVDAAMVYDGSVGVDGVKNAVSVVVVDSDIDRAVVGCGWFVVHKATHPTTSILSASRARSACRSRQDHAFMSADPFLM